MLVIAWLQVETINRVLTPAVGPTSHHYGMTILTQVINDSRRCLGKLSNTDFYSHKCPRLFIASDKLLIILILDFNHYYIIYVCIELTLKY